MSAVVNPYLSRVTLSARVYVQVSPASATRASPYRRSSGGWHPVQLKTRSSMTIHTWKGTISEPSLRMLLSFRPPEFLALETSV